MTAGVSMIIVTGASGKFGGAMIRALAARIAPDRIGASVRDPERAGDLRALGVRVRRGDLDDPDSLRSAFEGAAQLLIVSSSARWAGGDPLRRHRAAIGAGRAAGARPIVHTSHMGVGATSAFPPIRDHAATEAMLAGCGSPWTAHADLAEAAAVLLADEGRPDGPTPPLTGSEALDLADLAGTRPTCSGGPSAAR